MEIICNHKYINLIQDELNAKKEKILDFFKLSDISTKIVVWDNLDEYKNNLINTWRKKGSNREYQEYFIAHTEDGNINMLSFENVIRIDDFKDYTIDEYVLNVCHEFVHICQQAVKSNSPGWFWEVIATNLGNPENQHDVKSEFSVEDLYNKFDSIDGYGAVFSLGKYLFANYDNAFILSLVKDKHLIKNMEQNWVQKVNEIKQKNK